MTFISLGGHCELAASMAAIGARDTALPFDYVRSRFDGVIECIDNDFATFFPKMIRPEQIGPWLAFRGKNIGFYHHDLQDPTVIQTFRRRMDRFKEILMGQDKVIFVRTISSQLIAEEINMIPMFHDVMNRKFPNLNYILGMVILNQATFKHVLTPNSKTAILTVGPHVSDDLSKRCIPVLTYLKQYFNFLPKRLGFDYRNLQNLDMRVEGVEALDFNN